jgi:hypothetical protein
MVQNNVTTLRVHIRDDFVVSWRERTAVERVPIVAKQGVRRVVFNGKQHAIDDELHPHVSLCTGIRPQRKVRGHIARCRECGTAGHGSGRRSRLVDTNIGRVERSHQTQVDGVDRSVEIDVGPGVRARANHPEIDRVHGAVEVDVSFVESEGADDRGRTEQSHGGSSRDRGSEEGAQHRGSSSSCVSAAVITLCARDPAGELTESLGCEEASTS